MPDLISLALRSPVLRGRSVRPTTSRPSFQRSPLHSIRSRGVHTYLHVSVPASEIGRQPVSRSTFVVSHHLGGLLLLDPLRMLHRSSSHGVRGVSSGTPPLSPSRGPALRSVAPRAQQATSGWRTILAPGRRHPTGLPVGSPPALPPRPCLLDLEALLHARSRLSWGVATDTRALLPWACPDRCAESSRIHREPCSRGALGARQHALNESRQVRMNVKDRREAQLGSRSTGSDPVCSRSPSQHRACRHWRGGSPQPLPPLVTLSGT
jgi:hypothetical protein